MRIVEYDDCYRDDMIFMVLQAKDALGRKPTVNPDLLDIKANYISNGDMFRVAVDDEERRLFFYRLSQDIYRYN